MGLFVFDPDKGCTDCPTRSTCKTPCLPLKKYLARKFRAHNSVKAQSWGDFTAMDEAAQGGIRGVW